ncbi:hypothetical protein OWP15_11595 [Bacillus paranthracis]|uniref:hypothetical protein n=1 Tax=Bacillus paranthracis TaxID=2026186 RepID=UPI000789CBC2|nr:hypothetical protein [Bacillus paranthracis]KYQ01869.1 hypothetical protein B4079_3151 [Bacillus cereus]MDK7473358.1 hypothetical protein [Bacillus paranthracis]
MESIDVFLRILPVLTALGGYSINGYLMGKKNEKLRKQLLETDERLRANEMYEKVKNRRELFEETLTDLLCISEDANLSERKRAFMKCSQKYSALYNEIEDFCTKLFDGVINSQSYIKETVLPVLSELAEKQVEFYSELNEYANKYNIEKIRKPNFKAFEKYDKFLITYNGGESGHFWRKIKDMRRDSDFE